jgi:hypothetical protein
MPFLCFFEKYAPFMLFEKSRMCFAQNWGRKSSNLIVRQCLQRS